MRKIILMMSISLDGFFEGPDHDLSWHRVDEELHSHFNGRLAAMGAFFDGRVTYEGMAEFWPTADADPASTPAMVEFARIWRDMPKVVFSRTLDKAEGNATIAREVDVEEIQRLKDQPGGDIALGGANLATTFIQHGLVDEFWLYVHPVAIGQGTPWFQRHHLDLRLVETRTFGNGVVLLSYRPS